MQLNAVSHRNRRGNHRTKTQVPLQHPLKISERESNAIYIFSDLVLQQKCHISIICFAAALPMMYCFGFLSLWTKHYVIGSTAADYKATKNVFSIFLASPLILYTRSLYDVLQMYNLERRCAYMCSNHVPSFVNYDCHMGTL